jgi:hypothetical protein
VKILFFLHKQDMSRRQRRLRIDPNSPGRTTFQNNQTCPDLWSQNNRQLTSRVRAPVVSPTTNNRPINTRQQANGRQRAPVVSPTTNNRPINTRQQANGRQRAPVVSPTTNGRQQNGRQRAPVVSPTTNGRQQAPVVSPTKNGPVWAPLQGSQNQQRVTQTNNEITQKDRAFMQAGQPIPDFWTRDQQEPVKAAEMNEDRLNLNEPIATYLEADTEGKIFLVRDGMYHRLREDEGKVYIQTDGQCEVWTEMEPMEEDQIYFFSHQGVANDEILVNNQKLSGPVLAEMLRGPECAEIIDGLVTDDQQTDEEFVNNDLPVAPIARNGQSPNVPYTPGQYTQSTPVPRPQVSNHRGTPMQTNNGNNRNNGNWFATQWN